METMTSLLKKLIHINVMKKIRSFLTIILSMKMIYCENMEMDITALALKNAKMTQTTTVTIYVRIVPISMTPLKLKAL